MGLVDGLVVGLQAFVRAENTQLSTWRSGLSTITWRRLPRWIQSSVKLWKLCALIVKKAFAALQLTCGCFEWDESTKPRVNAIIRMLTTGTTRTHIDLTQLRVTFKC